ncbi:MAG: hypothetical protein V7K67_02200 [Nostoc sp.]|uniref:hypothetical protein n=1 Tax=Nostoc sp. TaxID=1180 RepID=UPI002FFCBDA4
MQETLYAEKLASYLYESNPVKYLQELYSDVDDCRSMSPEDKEQMLTDIAIALDGLRHADSKPTDNAPLPTTRRPDDFPSYQYDDNGLDFPCGVTETWIEDVNHYWEWYQYVYLPQFHPMPDQGIQHKCLTALALMNCQATIRDTLKIPIAYFEGKPGSGKSVMADALRSHFPERMSMEYRPGSTGASFRDRLHRCFGTGQPGICQIDNFFPDMLNTTLKEHYSIILATDKKSSVSTMSEIGSENRPSMFITHCFKVITSIHNGSSSDNSSMQEIADRCLFFVFKKQHPKLQRDAFNWDRMQVEYRKIWVDEWKEKNEKPYIKALSTLIKMPSSDTPFKGRDFDKVRVPIAVGTMLGMWSINDGMQALKDHIEWSSSQNTGIQSPFGIVVKEYVKSLQHTDSQADDDVYTKAWGLNKSSDVIAQTELFDHVKRVTTYEVGQRQSSDIVIIMSGLGYNHRQVGERMVFVKE